MDFRIGSRHLCGPNCSGPLSIVNKIMHVQIIIHKNDLKVMAITSITNLRQILDDLNNPTIDHKVHNF
jgi:hypothetical protein